MKKSLAKSIKNKEDRVKASEKNAKSFWDVEYKVKDKEGEDEGDIFKLSKNPGSDFLDFIKWLEKIDGKGAINNNTVWLDIGCGNGRHGLYLFEKYNANGYGYDLSSEAINEADKSLLELSKIKKIKLESVKVKFEIKNINQNIDIENESVDIVIEAMSNHLLKESERQIHLQELLRVLNYKGYLFLKTFLRDGDSLAKDLMDKYSGLDKNSYIHPKINVYEHVPSEDELLEMYSPYFDIEYVYRSHFHREKGKRRYIVMYLRKK